MEAGDKSSKSSWPQRGAQENGFMDRRRGLGRNEKKWETSMNGCSFWFEGHLCRVYSATATWPKCTNFRWDVFRNHSHTYTKKWFARAQTHHKHHKGKLRQLLGTQYKQPHQTCRQTDDYLHDKDLKYSPQNVFPWISFTTFHVYLQSKWAGFDIKAIFQRSERRRLWQHICQDWEPSFFF